MKKYMVLIYNKANDSFHTITFMNENITHDEVREKVHTIFYDNDDVHLISIRDIEIFYKKTNLLPCWSLQ